MIDGSSEQVAALVRRRSARRDPWSFARTLLLGSMLLGAPAGAEGRPAAPASQLTSGRPEVRLDRLDFPKDLQGAGTFRDYLTKILEREVRDADWGAGSDNRIEYRFAVTELRFTLEKDVLKVRCSAVGRLPGGQTAKSDLSFGGSPAQRGTVVKEVLEIVARGVITRLAELERRRRGLD